jgi:hypothetical protein
MVALGLPPKRNISPNRGFAETKWLNETAKFCRNITETTRQKDLFRQNFAKTAGRDENENNLKYLVMVNPFTTTNIADF